MVIAFSSSVKTLILVSRCWSMKEPLVFDTSIDSSSDRVSIDTKCLASDDGSLFSISFEYLNVPNGVDVVLLVVAVSGCLCSCLLLYVYVK